MEGGKRETGYSPDVLSYLKQGDIKQCEMHIYHRIRSESYIFAIYKCLLKLNFGIEELK